MEREPKEAASATPTEPGPSPGPADLGIEELGPFFARAAHRNEKALAAVRFVTLALAAIRHLMMHSAQMKALNPKYVFIFACMVVGVAFYGWTFATLKPGPALPWRLRMSVLFDIGLLVALIAAMTAIPAPTFHGLAHVPEFYALPLFVMLGGLRLSRSTAWIGAIAGLLAGIFLFGLDQHMNAPSITTNRGEVIAFFMILVGASLAAIATASGTRALVHEGAWAAVRAERARRRLGVYLSEAFAKEALEAPEPKAGGRRQQIAVLFCDLRGFTSRSESIPAESVVAELNAYFDAMVQAVRREDGVVDKFIGDALMVVFGVPKPRDDAARRAIRCAAAMREALALHNRHRAEDGLPSLENGVGAHFGEAIVGNVGNAERLQYTVIGDVVNTASRLEAATKEAGVPVLLSAALVEAAGGPGAAGLPDLVSQGVVPVRGRSAGVEVYSLADTGGTKAVRAC